MVISHKFRPEDENRPKTPNPVEYDNYPGHEGPMLRDGQHNYNLNVMIIIIMHVCYVNALSAIEAAIAEENKSDEIEPKEKLVLAGLTWVSKVN